MHRFGRVVSISLLMLTFACTALAGRAMDPQTGPHDRLFSQQTVIDVMGTVVHFSGSRLTLRSSQDLQTFDVFLAPDDYLRRKGIRIGAGARVRVKGSLVAVDQHAILIAEFLDFGARRLVFRDQSGLSRWDPRRTQSLTSVVKNYSGPAPCSMEVSISNPSELAPILEPITLPQLLR